jgi:hypothetical protein
MPQFTALIVTRRKDGVPATYTLTSEDLMKMVEAYRNTDM